eukprot:PhM_4_TR5567/c0_g1_i1/m.56856
MSVNDLQAVLKEAIRRKEKQLQVACEETTPVQYGDAITVEKMKPYIIGCAVPKHPKLVTLCASAISGVVTSITTASPTGCVEYMPQHVLQTLLTALTDINLKEVTASSEAEGLGVKLLQTYSTLLTSTVYVIPPLLVASAFSQLFFLFSVNPKASVLNSTSRATITQLTQHMYDQCKVVEVADAGVVRNAALLLRDLCSVADGNTGQWLRLSLNNTMTQCFALELVHDLILSHVDILKKFPAVFMPVLKDELCVSVVRGISTNERHVDTPLFLRSLKVSVALLQHFVEPLSDQLDMMLGIHTHSLEHRDLGVLWFKASVLLAWRTALLQQSTFLKGLSRKANLFASFYANVCGLMQTLADLISRNNNEVLAVTLTGDRLTLSKLEQLHHDDVRAQDVFLLCFDIMNGLCSGLAKLVDRDKGIADACVAVYVDLTWTNTLQVCGMLMERAADEDVLQSTLRCCQHMTHCCGWTQRTIPRDSFITGMTKHALPPLAAKPYVLTHHHTAVIKILINISNGLASVLGNCWYLLLKTFWQVEYVLSNLSAEQAAVHDVTMLHALLDNVVEASKFIEDGALVQMLQGLVQVSNDTLPQFMATGSNGTATTAAREPLKARPGYFSLSKMVLAVKNNLSRMALMQEIVATHLITMATRGEDMEMKRYAVESVSAMLQAYFLGTPRGSGGSIELDISLFSTLATIHKQATPEIRQIVLVELHKIVQILGPVLGGASVSIALSMLAISGTSGSAEEVAAGYRTVELICHDFLSNLEPDALMQLINCIGAYVKQTASGEKVNGNLSAIQLVWQVGDYCSTRCAATHTKQWLALFSHLRDASMDTRPEVRHGALKTLFSLIVTHGRVLPTSMRPTLLWDILVKLFEDVQRAAGNADGTDFATLQEAKANGSPSGEGSPQKQQQQQQLIVHHSRNSAAKQWVETVTVAVEGCVRTTRMFNEDGASNVETWTDYLRRITSCLSNAILSTSDEQSATGLKSLNVLLLDVTVDKKVSPSVVWDMAWTAWESYSELPHSGDSAVQSNVAAFIEGIADVRDKTNGGSWTTMCTRRFFTILERVMKSTAATNSFFYPSKVQATVLNVLKRFVPLADNGLWEVYFNMLIGFLPTSAVVERLVVASGPDHIPANEALSQLNNQGYHTELVVAILKVLESSLFECKDVKVIFMPDVVRAVANVALLRFVETGGKYTAWKCALATLVTIADDLSGNNTRFSGSYANAQMNALKEFSVLTHKYYLAPYASATLSRKFDADLDAKLLNVVDTVLLRPDESFCVASTNAFLLFLEKASTQRVVNTLRVRALQSLFTLVNAKTAQRLTVATAAMPILYRNIRSILSLYVQDDRSSGRVPLPTHREEEVLMLLKHIKSLEVIAEDVLWDAVDRSESSAPPSRKLPDAACGPHGLLVRLLPLFCRLVQTSSSTVVHEAATCCHVVCGELGLDGGM